MPILCKQRQGNDKSKFVQFDKKELFLFFWRK